MNSEFQKYLDKAFSELDVTVTKKGVFKVTIEEMVSETFEVEATNIEEAMQIAEEKYNNGEFVLEPGNLTCKQMMAEGDNETTEWVEF